MGFANFIFSNAFVLMFLPIWVAFLITLNFTVPSFRSKHFTRNLTLISTGICAVYSICLLFVTFKTGTFINNDIINWLYINDSLDFNFGFLLDNLSALFLVIFTVISFFIQLYSHEYMKNDECFHRYFVYLNIFNFSMSGLIISTNLIQTFVFLVLSGVCSYLLAGFWFKKKSVSDVAKKSFIINFFGDCLFLLGTILLLYFAICYFPQEDFSSLNFSSLYGLGQGIIPYASYLGFSIICLIFIISLFIKSAQFPFQRWFTETKETPMPAKALISTSTVTVGLYLVIRMFPLLNLSSLAIKFILYFGLASALICSFLAIFQNDIRKNFSYILCSQIGLGYVAISIFTVSAGLFHTINVSFAIVLLFLLSGMIGAIYNNMFDIRYMGDLRKDKPILAFCFIIALLSLSGIFFSGCLSSWQLLSELLSKGKLFEYFLFLISVFFISFSLFRTYFLIFGKNMINKLCDIKFHFPVKLSITVLLLSILVIGFILNNNLSLMFDINSKADISKKGILIFYVVNFLSLIVSFILYKLNKLKIFIPQKLSTFFEEELFIEKTENIFLKYIFTTICRILNFIDKYIIGGIPKLIGLIIKLFSVIATKFQTGNIQSYILGSIFGIILALLFVLFYYFKLKGF